MALGTLLVQSQLGVVMHLGGTILDRLGPMTTDAIQGSRIKPRMTMSTVTRRIVGVGMVHGQPAIPRFACMAGGTVKRRAGDRVYALMTVGTVVGQRRCCVMVDQGDGGGRSPTVSVGNLGIGCVTGLTLLRAGGHQLITAADQLQSVTVETT